MKLHVNGEEYIAKGARSVDALLQELDIPPQRVAVEVNLKVISKADYPRVELKEGDRVEIVSFVGGG